jgi:hypothetical protein
VKKGIAPWPSKMYSLPSGNIPELVVPRKAASCSGPCRRFTNSRNDCEKCRISPAWSCMTRKGSASLLRRYSISAGNSGSRNKSIVPAKSAAVFATGFIAVPSGSARFCPSGSLCR